jgi:hypothetical protein
MSNKRQFKATVLMLTLRKNFDFGKVNERYL